jgi:hypothetical protein
METMGAEKSRAAIFPLQADVAAGREGPNYLERDSPISEGNSVPAPDNEPLGISGLILSSR